jgi:nucleoredoxin
MGFYFGASWCGPCGKFMPKLKELYAQLKEAGHDFEVVYVSADQSAEQWEGYRSKSTCVMSCGVARV